MKNVITRNTKAPYGTTRIVIMFTVAVLITFMLMLHRSLDSYNNNNVFLCHDDVCFCCHVFHNSRGNENALMKDTRYTILAALARLRRSRT